MANIKNMNVLITGAAGGIGFSYAQQFLKNGAKMVSILDFNTSAGTTAVANLEKEFGKGKALFYTCDVTNVQLFEETFKKAVTTMNGVDIVINNAGLLNDKNWEKTLRVNCGAVIQGSLLAMDLMSKHKGGKGGTLVNIASIVALDVFPICPVYCSSKHQVLAFSRALQPSFDRTGVRVLVMCPGVTTTNLFNAIQQGTLDFLDKDEVINSLKDFPTQLPENVAKAMVTLIQKGQNGDVRKDSRTGNMQIKDKRAIVTGAASDLGLTISRELLRNGVSIVALIDIRESAGTEAMNALNAEFGRNRAVFFHCDVTNNSQFDDTFKTAVKTLGGLEILINNAGVINESDFSKAIDVNVTAVIRGTLLGIQQMQRDAGGKGGVIVNISSVAGLHSISQLPVYSATKHAVVSFSRSFAQPYHYQRTGVRIIVLCRDFTQAPNDLPEGQSLSKYQPHRVDSIAHGLVYAIRCAQNGSIWISEDGKPVYEIQLSDSLPVKPDEFSLEYSQSRQCLAEPIATSDNEMLGSCAQTINVSPRRRRSSASEKAKEIEAINGLVSGKNVLITGGAAGLGHAFLNHFLKHGANKVTIFDIDVETGKKIELSVEKSCGEKKVYFIHVDVSNYARMTEAFEEALKLMNDIDIVVNNAGILDERRWEREIAVNIGGMISTAMLAMKYMSKDNLGHGGTLVNVSQHIDIKSTAQLPVYTATKHAIIGLSQSLADAYQYEKTGIRVITLCPGLTETALTVDSPNKLLSRVMKADFVKNLEQLSIQTPYVVAQGLMSILRVGVSGSIWVVESGRNPYEVYVPNPRTLRRAYKNNFTIVETKPMNRGRPIREVCDNTRTGLMSCA
nr:peroxisomal hydratase-dehydrogenase-epimerase-like [Nomia melanderi]